MKTVVGPLEAMQALYAGKKIRNTDWPEGEYMLIGLHGSFYYHDLDGDEFKDGIYFESDCIFEILED